MKRSIFVAAVVLALLVIGFVPLRGNNSSLLRTCGFDEAAGIYSKCFWSWDKALRESSIYF
jgi:hypothetical protein